MSIAHPIPTACLAFAAFVVLAGCDRRPVDPAPPERPVAPPPAGAPPAATAPAAQPEWPPAPGQPGGLPDDRSPLAEGPIASNSAMAAADLVQTYYALIEQRRYADARRLWSGEGEASGASPADFAADFASYADYHANVGAPGAIEGAAGSLYVEVPIQVYGRTRDGGRFSRTGTVAVRRVNDVPGSTAGQRRWHIARIELSSPTP